MTVKKGYWKLNQGGGYTIAESEETAVVFGMPSEVIKTGAVDRVLPLPEVPVELIKIVKRGQD